MQVICLGEAMGEISSAADGRFAVGVGGDTFNTAIYLARVGVETAFASMVGTDPFGALIRQTLYDNDVSDALLLESETAATGLYSITNAADGERSFHYWREAAAARGFFRAAPQLAIEALLTADCLYLSGVSLWVLQSDAARLIEVLAEAKSRGVRLFFDSNYRPKLWGGQEARARQLFGDVMGLCNLVLPTYEDEVMLWGDASPTASLDRIAALGATSIVLKQGSEGCLVRDAGHDIAVPVPQPCTPLDTTAAGDSFNAAYIAAILGGAAPHGAALAGHDLAGKVIRTRGAILPR